uniref:hypothetical protein n=1 Tax=Pseudomonas viridiflava TaxID=33069 RepID=UPI00197D599F
RRGAGPGNLAEQNPCSDQCEKKTFEHVPALDLERLKQSAVNLPYCLARDLWMSLSSTFCRWRTLDALTKIGPVNYLRHSPIQKAF